MEESRKECIVRNNGGVMPRNIPERLVSPPLSVPTRPRAANACRLALPRWAHDTAGVVLPQNQSAAFPALGITACHGLGSKTTSHTARGRGGRVSEAESQFVHFMFLPFCGSDASCSLKPGLQKVSAQILELASLEQCQQGERWGATQGQVWGQEGK